MLSAPSLAAALLGTAALLVGADASAQFVPPLPYPTPQPYGAPGYGPPAYGPPPFSPQKRDETPAGGLGGATAGFRAARLDADIAGADDTYGFMASGASVAVASVKFLTMRAGIDAHIGGGSEDVEARIGGHLTFGVIGHWAPTNGMFIRVGLGGNYEGNGRYTFSHFDLPLGDGGYQFHGDGFGLEVGVRGGATLTGRVGMAPSANVPFGVVGRWGGYVTLAVATNKGLRPGMWLDAEFIRLEADRPINVGSGRVCGGYLGFVCIDGRILHADLPFGTAVGGAGTFDDAVTLYTGITVGVGSAVAVNGISAFAGL